MKGDPKWYLPEDRCFDPYPSQRKVAMELYRSVANLPIVSPHGHVDPRLLRMRRLLSVHLPTSSSLAIITFSACSIRRASLLKIWEFRGLTLARLRGIIGRSGRSSQITFTSFAAPRLAHGWLTNSILSSASKRN